MMTLEVFKKIIPQVAPLTDQVTLHLMGDPLVHPRLAEFLAVCSDYQVPVFFVSNAVLLNESKADLLLHPIIRQVNFSLHSFHDNHGDKDPTIYLDKIFRYTERAFAERPDLYINYRLWNLDEPRGSGANNHSMMARINEHFQVNLDEKVDVRLKKSLHIKNRLYLHFDTEFVWPSLDLPEIGKKGTCYGLSNHFGILADGTVVPCCLDKEGKIPLGHVQEKSILEILDSGRAVEIFQAFRANKLVDPLCQRCNYITRFS